MWCRKSQIAIEYCYRFEDEHPTNNVFWVYTNSVLRFNQAYRGIARKLDLPEWDKYQG